MPHDYHDWRGIEIREGTTVIHAAKQGSGGIDYRVGVVEAAGALRSVVRWIEVMPCCTIPAKPSIVANRLITVAEVP